jgi:hypothetical protein
MVVAGRGVLTEGGMGLTTTGQDQHPTGLNEPSDLGKGGSGIIIVLQHLSGDDHLEGTGQRDLMGVADNIHPLPSDVIDPRVFPDLREEEPYGPVDIQGPNVQHTHINPIQVPGLHYLANPIHH